MNFDWNPDTIKWYEEANEYTGFFKSVADLIAPKIKGYSTFCDIGCGLGLIDIELSKSIQYITCIDINENAVRSLNKKITDKNITNIETVLSDYRKIIKSWDIIYISFFRGSKIEEFLPYCKQLFAVVNKNDSESNLKKYRTFNKITCEKVEQELKDKNIEYSLTEVSFEFGQPLTSIEDAKNYIRSSAPSINEAELDGYLNEKLIETKVSRFPYYIPKRKPIGIFQIKGDID